MSVVRARRIHKQEGSSNMLMLELERILRAEWLMQRVEDFATTHVAGGGTNPLGLTCDAVECQYRLMLYIVV